MPNFFSHPTPRSQHLLLFSFLPALLFDVVWKNCLGAYLVAVGTHLCRVAMLVRAVLFAGGDHEALMLGGPPRGRVLQLRGLNVATMAFT